MTIEHFFKEWLERVGARISVLYRVLDSAELVIALQNDFDEEVRDTVFDLDAPVTPEFWEDHLTNIIDEGLANFEYTLPVESLSEWRKLVHEELIACRNFVVEHDVADENYEGGWGKIEKSRLAKIKPIPVVDTRSPERRKPNL